MNRLWEKIIMYFFEIRCFIVFLDNDLYNLSFKIVIFFHFFRNEHFNKTQCIGVSSLLETAATISDISSDSESDAEVENNDLAKFLGLSKSPVVSQALEILGFTPTTPTSLNGNNGSGIRNRQNNKKAMASGTDNSKATPTSVRSKGQANVLSPASKNTYSES